MARVRPSRHLLIILILLAAALAFYLWTAATSIPFSFSSAQSDIYNLMATGFLHGHTYLPITPPAGLLHLKDPYDPAQNAPYQIYHDLALRNGHFYSPWGPSPVLPFLLFRLTPFSLSQSFGVAMFAFVGLVCAVWLLHIVVQHFVSGRLGWLLVIATAGLALTNAVGFLLRRPAQYELAIAGGYAYEMAGLLLVVTAVIAVKPRLWRLATGSLLLGLAVAARPTLAVGGLVALAAAWYLIRRRGSSYRVLVPALVPVVVCGLALAVYNDVRFGSPSEFGQHYQLAGLDVQHKPTDQLAYVPPGVFSYLLVPARVSLTFPHFFLMTDTEYPWSLPAGYSGTVAGGPAEPAGGMFSTMPITLLVLILPFFWLRRRRPELRALVAATGLAGMSIAVIVLLSYALWGTTQRYEVDFATLGLLAAFLVWAMLIVRAGSRIAWRRTIVIVGIVLTAFGAAVGTAVSFTGYYDILEVSHPGTFRTLEDITSPLATLATMVAGHPVLTRVSGPEPVTLPPQGYGAFGERGASTSLGSAGPVTVTVIAPHSQSTALVAIAAPGPGAPPLTSLDVRVTSAGRPPVTVPLLGASVKLPVHLGTGLNRISLSLSRPVASTQALSLSAIELDQ